MASCSYKTSKTDHLNTLWLWWLWKKNCSCKKIMLELTSNVIRNSEFPLRKTFSLQPIHHGQGWMAQFFLFFPLPKITYIYDPQLQLVLCHTGYTGRVCDVNPDECSNVTCVHGQCHDGLDKYTCECHDGYVGPMCEVWDCTYCTVWGYVKQWR